MGGHTGVLKIEIHGRAAAILFITVTLSLFTNFLAIAPRTYAASPTTFAETGAGAGQIENLRGMDVDQTTGQLFLADLNNFRIDRFSAAGEFELAWGLGVRTPGSLEFQTCGPQADPPSAKCFSAEGAARTTTTPGAVKPIDIAVDQSGHDVYVASAGGPWIQKFSPDGGFLLMFGKEVNSTTGADVCIAADVEIGDECGAGLRNNEAGTTYEDAFYGGASGTELPIAVDSAGHVWVLDRLWLREFSEGGEFLEGFALPAGFTQATDLAVDSAGRIYVVGNPEEGVHEFEVTGPGTLTEVGAFDAVAAKYKAIALDGSSDLYVADRPDGGDAVFRVFDHTGIQIGQFGASQLVGTGGPQGIAVGDAAEALYATATSFATGTARYWAQRFHLPEPGPLPESEAAAELLPTEAALTGTLNPEGKETTYHFEWGTDEGYGEETASATLAAGFEGKLVQAHLEHLTPATTYHWRLFAENESGTFEGPDRTFQARPTVAVEGGWATEVTATAATLHAELDPLGPEAEWWVEYGAGEGYGQATAVQILPTGSGTQSVEVHVQGLEPGTLYHWRLAARDEREGTVYTSHGPDRTLRTQLTAARFALPDGRAWEMVSPADKHGGEITFQFDGYGLWQAAADGDAVTYLSLGSIDAEPEGNRALEFSQIMGRHGPGGWLSQDVTLPHSAVTTLPVGFGSEYRLFSPDLSNAIVEPRDGSPLSPKASERAPYLRSNFSDPAGYDPLVTGREPYANVPPGTEFGGKATQFQGAVEVRGATPDLSHVILQSKVPLVSGAPAGALYESSGGLLQLVSRLPEADGGAAGPGQLGSYEHSVTGAISTDGSRVFWSNNTETALYMRDTSIGETVRLDTMQPGATGRGSTAPTFLGAAADGSLAYFTDSEQLTEGASESGTDLYACAVVTGAGGRPECRLIDLTANGREGAGVLGIAGIDEVGDDIYFVANGVLTGAEQNPAGESATPGSCSSTQGGAPIATPCNLYLAHYDGTSWNSRFIAIVSQGDSYDWGGSLGGQASQRTAAASPDGRYLAFMSQRSLTGFDNRDAASGERDEEVFRYDSMTAQTVCVSCDPSGARPHGIQMEHGGVPSKVDQSGLWSREGVAPGEKTRWLAAAVPDPIKMFAGYSTYQSRYMLDNGKVFFNTTDDLVPGDSNGTWDVYQYEPAGNGDCTSGSGGAATAHSADGCVGLLSAGTDEQESAFLDAGTSGDDAFILTAAKLSPKDADSEYDVYDTHVCGSGWNCEAPEPTPPASCESGSACRSTGPSPGDGAPATAGFSGGGNVGQMAKCSVNGKRAKRLSRRRNVLRRHAMVAARHGHPNKAKKLRRKARGLGKRGKRESGAASFCRSHNRKASR